MAHLPLLLFLIRLNNQKYQFRLILNEPNSFVKYLMVAFTKLRENWHLKRDGLLGELKSIRKLKGQGSKPYPSSV
jgi:hypothetical protein